MELVAIPDNDTDTLYVLNERLEPVEANRDEWLAFLKTDAATVAVTNFGGRAKVVTTFTGVDDGFAAEGEPPYVFETMSTFYDGGDDYEGHRTWLEAEERHRGRVQEIAKLLRMLPHHDEQVALPL